MLCGSAVQIETDPSESKIYKIAIMYVKQATSVPFLEFTKPVVRWHKICSNITEYLKGGSKICHWILNRSIWKCKTNI